SLIAAIDRQSGRTRWTRSLRSPATSENSPDPNPLPFQQFTPDASLQTSPADGTTYRSIDAWQMAMDQSRLYTISSVSDSRSQLQREDALRNRMFLGRDAAPPVLWELSAIDKISGRRLWTAGGETVEDRFGNPLAESWFPSLPTPLGPDLFVLAEKDGQLNLACLAAHDGSLHWQLPLMFPEFSIQQDLARQLIAAQLASHEGLLLASTSTGWVFAVDPLTQSVLWAQKLADGQPEQTHNLRNGRGIVQLRIQAARNFAINNPSAERRPEAPLVVGDEVLWTLSEITRPTVTHILSGKIQRKLPGNDDQLVLTADQNLLVTASPTEIRAYNLRDFSPLWKSSHPSRLQVPVGTAVRRGDQLLIPTADGSIQVRNLQSGEILETIYGLRPVQQPGALAASSGELISAGPGYLTLASNTPPTPQPGEDRLEQAAFLLAANQPAQALNLLDATPPATPTREQHQRLQFRAALCIYAQNQNSPETPTNLLRLKSLAASPAEQAIACWLELASPNNSQAQPRTSLLFAALKLPAPVLSVDLPNTQTLLEIAKVGGIEDLLARSNSAENNAHTPRTPLRSLIIQELQSALNSPTAELRDAVLNQASQLSDQTLCSIIAPNLAAECLSRAQKQLNDAVPTETTLHLLFAAAENLQTSPPANSDSPELKTLRQLFTTASQNIAQDDTRTPFEHALLQNLINSLAADILPALPGPDAANHVPDSSALTATPQTWQAVADSTWRLIPVSTNGQINMRVSAPRNLRSTFASDPVLALGRWSIQPESGDLVGAPFNNTTPGSFRIRLPTPANHQMLTSEESLLRCGSVFIHRSLTSISAFSILDRRWLWTRSAPASSFFDSSINLPFTEFDPDREGRKLHDRERRIAGFTRRWLCLLTEKQLEVLDLLTGESLWHTNAQGLSPQLYACNSAILLQTLTNNSGSTAARTSEILLNPANGLPVTPASRTINLDDQQELKLPVKARLAALHRRIITASGNLLVAWDPQSRLDDTKTLEWIDIQSLETVRKLELEDFASAQFLDQQLLAVFTRAGKVLLVNLHSGATQTLDGAAKTADLDEIPPSQIGIAADSANLYLFQLPDPDNGQLRPSALYNIQSTRARNQLRAIDRQSGSTRWAIPLPSPTYFIFDQSPEPVLLALQIEENNPAPNNPIPGLRIQGLPRIEIQGFAKADGKPLFKCPIVSQFPVPGLRLQFPNSNTIELEAFGNRVRLVHKSP
ncbi:MAG: hypothetical protein RL215_2620, partial [Planctomycetota bacterium]